MEDKLPSKETHLWTLSDFIERRKEWDQGDEARLAEYLQQLSIKITQGAKNTLNELDDLVASIDDTAVQIANINNEFQLLADKQFIENKVQEEDETVQTKAEKPVVREINEADTFINNIKEALKNSFKAIDNHFEKITVIVSDSDDSDDELKHEETVLRPRIFYKKLNLPSLSGNTLSDIVVDNVMLSDSDSDVERPTNTFKDQESLSSNDASEENIYDISESKKTYEPIPESVETNNVIFESENSIPKNIPSYAHYDEDDLFTPPPLINDDDDENLEDEYNIFGNGSSKVFGENNLWDDIDDDDNEPPLSIYSDKPPQQETKSNTQEKVGQPSIQQTLNDELRKRFQKDSTSSSDNVNVISKIKLPKGAVNILGGTDVKPYISGTAQNTRTPVIPEMSKKVIVPTQNDTVQDIKKDFNISNKLVDNSNSNLVTVESKELTKETKPMKKRSLFDQESDDDDLFTNKTTMAFSATKPDILESKESLIKDKKLSTNIFSDEDSDEDFMDSKLKTKGLASHSIIDNNSTKPLDSSFDDDLFNIQSINKTISKEKSVISSSPILVEVSNKSNEITHVSKPPVPENILRGMLNEEHIDKLENNAVSSKVANTKLTEKKLLPNKNILNSNNMESPNNDNIMIQINQKSPILKQTKKFSNFFSSDEDESDDDILFNTNETNKNSIVKDQLFSNAKELGQNKNYELQRSKLNLFDSSSDDDIFITNKPSSISKKESILNEIKNIGTSKQTDAHTIINNMPNIDKINQTGNDIIDKSNSKTFSVLSDDDGDEIFLSFDKNISDACMDVSNNQSINDKILTVSLSSEEFLSPQMDQKNQDIFQSTPPDNFKNNKDHESFSQKEIHMPKNENTFQSNKSSMFSSSDDEQFIFSPQIKNENSFKESKIIPPTSNLPQENLLNNKNQESFNENDIKTTSLPISSENTNQDIKNSIISNSDDNIPISFNSDVQNVNTIDEIEVICPPSDLSLKDSIDGPIFSSPNSKNETSKKIPGKLSKNAGAFINIASLLPNSKIPLKISNIAQSVSLDEKNDDTLPTNGTKLFSAEKERVRIQVKRRPQSRKARIAAARMSSIDIGSETDFQESSRLFVSTSNLVDYQSSPILNDNITDTDSSNEVKKNILEPFNTKSFVDNDYKIYENSEKTKTKTELEKKSFSDLFDYDSDPLESFQQEFDSIDSNNTKKFTPDEQLLESNKSIQEQNLEIEPVHEKLLENKSIKEIQPEVLSTSKKLPKIDPISEIQVKTCNVENLQENKSKSPTSNNLLPQKYNSLFDDDDDDDDIFSQKSGKVNKPTSNIFDSDDEFEFNSKFVKKKSDKTKSIFDDDSDDDLFNTSSKPSGSNLTSKKPIDKLSQQQNRSVGDGYVKLAAESVAINPLESKEN
ncbi:PREDICTED: WASH complex subunit FAM21 [Diuraphis noxia]|uniref:WASH complex subunit FAM21 n=1 Tax=Diuraphis noxia TaxID=143948 RepID=UPI000763638F|nr:PREDICTED: WASH complex subunit FAM21 [Diuraphis noxia]